MKLKKPKINFGLMSIKRGLKKRKSDYYTRERREALKFKTKSDKIRF